MDQESIDCPLCLVIPYVKSETDMKYLPRLLYKLYATADYRAVSAVCHKCIQSSLVDPRHRNHLQHHNGRDETSPCKDPRRLRSI